MKQGSSRDAKFGYTWYGAGHASVSAEGHQ